MMGEYIHYTKDGDAIPISKMGDSHLLNMIRLIRRKAKEGIMVEYGGTGVGIDLNEIWYDQEEVDGEEAERLMNLNRYTDEAKRRGLTEEN